MDTTTATGNTKPALVGAHALTKQGKPSKRSCREGNLLLAYAVELGGRVPVNDETKAEMARRGLKPNRWYNAAYELRTFCGKNVTDERDGKVVLAYVIPL